jgi:chromosome segregation ATPase
MNSVVINDEFGGIRFYVGMEVKEGDLEILEGLMGRLFKKMRKLEKQAPTPEGTRLNILEYAMDTFRKEQIDAKKVLDEMKEEVATLAQRLNLNRKAHTRIYKELDDRSKAIEQLQYSYIDDVKNRKRMDRRLSDVEEFVGDL